jgi:hypothetical protein
MKGHLYKKIQPEGWYVTYTADDFGFHKRELPIHPEYLKCYFLDEDDNGTEVEFEIVISALDWISYARLIPYNHEESTKEPDIKYDKPKNKIVKLAEEEWVECDGCNDNDKYFWIKGFHAGQSHTTIPEISDEDIRNESIKYTATFQHWDSNRVESFIYACEWYKEQLKNKI